MDVVAGAVSDQVSTIRYMRHYHDSFDSTDFVRVVREISCIRAAMKEISPTSAFLLSTVQDQINSTD